MAPAPGIPDRGDSPKVTIDLQAAQSAGYRDRGVARYAMDYTTFGTMDFHAVMWGAKSE